MPALQIPGLYLTRAIVELQSIESHGSTTHCKLLLRCSPSRVSELHTWIAIHESDDVLHPPVSGKGT